MNQQHGNRGFPHRVFRRDLVHVQAVLPTRSPESNLHNRTQDRSPDPRAQMKWLPHAIVSDLAKVAEGRFGNHRAKWSSGGEGLQQLRRSHGLAKSVDTSRLSLCPKKVDPLTNVVPFEQAVGGQFSSARAMGAGIRE